MAGENQVVAEPAAEWHWPRTLVSLAFLVLHVAGGAYALVTLALAWFLGLLLRLLVERTLFFRLLHVPWIVIPVGLVLVALLAAVEVRRTLGRWRRHQPEPDVGLRVRALAYVVLACIFVNAFFLSTPETFSGPFRVRFQINALISAAFAYGAYALWSLQLPRLRRVFPDRVRRGLDVVGMNVALLLVLAELSLRVVAAFWPSPLLVTASSSSQIRRDADRQPPGSLRFGFPINKGGHYDTEFVPRSATPNQIVVWIGDSFSYGTVPHAYHFTTVAERELPGVDVYNMGYPGLGPSDYLHLLEDEALPLDPDLVVVELFIGNDVTENPSPPGPARWYDADSYLLAIVWHRLQIMRQAKLVDVAQTTKSSNVTQEPLTILDPWLTDPLLEGPSMGSEVFLQLEARNASWTCLSREGVYPRFFATLTQIERAAGNVPLAFMVIPDEFQVEDDLWEEVGRRSGQPLDRDLAQRTIVAWMNARGRAVLDLLPLMRAVKPMKDGRRHLYHLRDTHFNARGNEVAGRALARLADSVLSAPPVRHARGDSRKPTPPPLRPVSLPFHVVFGDSALRRWMQDGWSLDEASGGLSYVWSDGLESSLWVPLPKHGDIRMDFEANPFVFPNSPQQRVAIVLNGTTIEEVPLRSGLHQYSVILPQKALLDSPSTLQFHYAYARVPQEVLANSADVRRLAVAWYSINFAAGNH